jgi:hypothetical protein
MREKVREFLNELSLEEKYEVIRAIFPGLAEGLTEERAMTDLDGVTVGTYVPFAKWRESQPPMKPPSYKTQEEATEAAKNGPSLSEVIARLEAAEAALTSK